MSEKRPEDLMLRVVELIREIGSNSDAIVVEGTKDLEALRRLGSTSTILVMFHEPIADFVERTAGKHGSVTILTDYDRKGKDMNRSLNSSLQKRGIFVRSEYRAELGRLMAGLKIRCIESLSKVLENTERALQRGILEMREMS